MNKKASKKVSPYYSLKNIARLLNEDVASLKKIAEKAYLYYTPYDIEQEKKDGSKKIRHIDSPNKELKIIQRRIYKKILKKEFWFLPAGMLGGIAGKSIKDNAKPHLKQEMVVTIDIKNCFPKTNHKSVFKAWRNTIDCSEDVARLMTQLTTFHTRLPQGAPTSSALCNFCLLPLFYEVLKYAQEHDISFTLYVDDITISGKALAVCSAIQPIITIICSYGYAVSNKKIRKMPANMPQYVTGQLVNKKVSLSYQIIDELRATIIAIAKREDGITTTEKRSIAGKIQYVEGYSEEKAEKLYEFAEMILPKIIAPDKIKKEPIKRTCKHHRNKK